jgi:glutamate-5-semialdehyde dehydrogenase
MTELRSQLLRAREASISLADTDRAAALHEIAARLLAQSGRILEANAQDLAAEEQRGTAPALLDRLRLDTARIRAMSEAVRLVADLPDPVGRVLADWRLANGLQVRQVTVPFGVMGMIYESRPNVTVDAAVLTLKAASAVVLRGSSNALGSNRVLVQVIRESLAAAGVPEDAVQLIDSAERERVTELLTARGLVDLVIPRGGAGLIRHVVENARVPVIETGTGNCHVYVDEAADLPQAHAIVLNAKLQRPGVCNAMETLLVHEGIAADFLAGVAPVLRDAGVSLRGCVRTLELLPGTAAASESDWAEEFLGPVLAVRVVSSVQEAVEHIRRYGSGHSEAIVSEDSAASLLFQQRVDAAVVYVNASTRFTDGFEVGFGAELGISTQKLHARGPLGLNVLVTSKYLVEGSGQVRA